MKKKNEAVETVLCERVLSAEEVACISVQIQQELEAYIDPVKREYLPRFFKTGKGQYGEGDKSKISRVFCTASFGTLTSYRTRAYLIAATSQ